MALIISGKSTCPLCGLVMQKDEEIYGFPAFVGDESDPIYPYSDAGFHTACLAADPLGMIAIEAVDEWYANTGPGKRHCTVCGVEVMNHDDYLGLDYLARSADHPLRRFNYIHLHKSCVPRWEARAEFIATAKEVIAAGEWAGNVLPRLVARLEKLA